MWGPNVLIRAVNRLKIFIIINIYIFNILLIFIMFKIFICSKFTVKGNFLSVNTLICLLYANICIYCWKSINNTKQWQRLSETLTGTAFSFLKIGSNHILWHTPAQQATDGHIGQRNFALLQYWSNITPWIPHFKSKSHHVMGKIKANENIPLCYGIQNKQTNKIYCFLLVAIWFNARGLNYKWGKRSL